MTEFVLASGSQIRRQILDNAGIDFTVEKPDVDESVIKDRRSDLSPAGMALVLGKAKAEAVSRGRPRALVLGADQTMELDGALLDKLPDAALARDRLMAMRGRAGCPARRWRGWRHTASPATCGNSKTCWNALTPSPNRTRSR